LWFSGVGLLGVAILTAFLGYTLPWGQISFWGATVITSLVSTLPVVGWKLVIWLWGGFRVGSSALLLFYTAHYSVPIIMACLVVVHLMLLHQGGSHTQLRGLGAGGFIPFTPYFVWKDITSLTLLMFLYGVSLCNPWVFADVENWLEADPLSRPVHIQPEWYFLFAYAILRAVPRKLGGVLALLARVLILAVIPFLVPQTPKRDQIVLFFGGCLLVTWVLLTWLGGCPVERPFLAISQVFSVLYFLELIAIRIL
jgi:ubiquinol-cytochrome c reductase cytochrome b subunit